MDVVDKKRDRRNRVCVDVLALLLPLLAELLVKLDEEQRLVLHVGEQVVLADEVEHVRAAQTEEERKRLSGLSVESIPTQNVRRVSKRMPTNRTSITEP